MSLDSFRESKLLQLEQYLNSNPYREYSMSKPYLPRTFLTTLHSHRLMQEEPEAFLALNGLMNLRKDSTTLDRIAYKLRMKSDLNIDTLRDTRSRPRHRSHHEHNPSHAPPSKTHRHAKTTTSSDGAPSSITNVKTPRSEAVSGIEGNAVRVGTLEDLIKQYRRTETRLARHPVEHLDNPSIHFSSTLPSHDRSPISKTQGVQERAVRQAQSMTEYHFNAPLFPAPNLPHQRRPMVHRAMAAHRSRTRERLNSGDLALDSSRSPSTPELHPQRSNSPLIHERPLLYLSSKDRRIQESREKSLMRMEKQPCVCSKLTIVDPFNTPMEQSACSLPRLQPPLSSSVQYLFPPVRAFGYYTRKLNSLTDEIPPFVPTSPPRTKKAMANKPVPSELTGDSLEVLDGINIDEDGESQGFCEASKSITSSHDSDHETYPAPITVHVNTSASHRNTADEL